MSDRADNPAPLRPGLRKPATRVVTILLTAAALAGAAVAPAVAAPAGSTLPAARKLELKGLISEINDWSCKPAAGQEPVVLIHGTFGFKQPVQAADRWREMGTALKADGYCVYALEYGTDWLGTMGVGDIRKSAQQLSTFVAGVKEATGAAKVDLIGYSQGGLVARSYVKDQRGAASVDDLIGLGAPNRGTATFPAWVGSWLYPAVKQMLPDSTFLQGLNRGGDLLPGINYTMLAAPRDEVVKPYTSAYLAGSAQQLTNVDVPDNVNPQNPHSAFCSNPLAIEWVREALRSPGPARPDFKAVDPSVGG